MPLNDRGSITPFRLPPESRVWDELKNPTAEYRKLVSDRHLAYTRLGKLENDRKRAIERDRLALAKALREGGEDPGDAAVEKIDKDTANTRRIIEALELAIEAAEQELIEVVDDHKSTWLADVDTELDGDAQEYLAAIEQMEAARTKLTESVALKRFLSTFPEHGYNPGHWHVFGLIARNGDPFNWGEVVEALRKDAEVGHGPEQEPEPQEHGGGIVEQFSVSRGMADAAYAPSPKYIPGVQDGR